MSVTVESMVETKSNPRIAEFAPGDTIKVNVKIVEGDKERVQAFEGVVIRIRKGTANAAFTVRRTSLGIGVERTFFFHSPRVEKVELLRKGKVRRAKLYYLRGLRGKAAKIKGQRGAKGVIVPTTEAPPEAETIMAAPAAETVPTPAPAPAAAAAPAEEKKAKPTA